MTIVTTPDISPEPSVSSTSTQSVPPPPVTPEKSARKIWLIVLVAVVAVALLAGAAIELIAYASLTSSCRSAVIDEANARLDRARSESSSIDLRLTDIEVSDPIYSGPFRATVPAKISAQATAGIISQSTSVPLQCNAVFVGKWRVDVSNAAT